MRPEQQRERTPRRSTATTVRRLGLLEYTLLAVIVLGIAVTIVMAIVNP